ncbi:MAG: hypothetical protein OH319_00780 [Candidatus Parvarchaeota archaeon]|nr:hypothetical protein [Candidatus Jingweiarchaeum tengchongense]MCW1297887.1 hypothetical protein [Candidatus Jingweiarchaeum tengchongense]MCW1299898.1 hypothetical protein [Candidatus Jingweiarchaeum tengchongense]MCW1305098.1 hypothetical protein [Candidatus Jingweiarchaeum tengchongense]MCW1305160.1 hypothetical protein [Candidatus Jingweiarchaeum tengchongense]
MKIVKFWVKGKVIKIETPWHTAERRMPSEWEEKLYLLIHPLTRKYGAEFCFLIKDVLDYPQIENEIKRFPAIQVDDKIVHQGDITLQELIDILENIKRME